MDSNRVQGKLLIIGGAEDKDGECVILKRLIALAGGNQARVLIVTTATEEPRDVGREYKEIFRELGAEQAEVLDIRDRRAAGREDCLERLEKAGAIFFTGGDQLRITSLLGGTPLDRAVRKAYASGAVIAGTSAGASAMSETMIVGGDSGEAPRQDTLRLAPGLGLLAGVVIDQHFAQRGRMGRLLVAVAQNPGILGVGVDEDTALEVSPAGEFRVIGSQTVTIIDGRDIGETNISEVATDENLAMTGVKLHVLPAGYGYSLPNHRPLWKENS